MEADRIIGANVRRLRIERRLSLAEFSISLGVSHQQLQKYETGANRLSAGLVPQVAARLHVPIIALFEGVDSVSVAPADKKAPRLAALRSECLYLVSRADSEAKLKQIVNVVRALL